MRLRTFFGAAALFAVACSPAFADELFTLTDGTNTITFTLPTNPAVNADSDFFVVPNVSVDIDGSIMSDSLYFYDATESGGLAIYSPTTTLTYLTQTGAVLFSGSLTDPTFSNGGLFALTNYDTPVYDNNFTLNITTAGAPVTPEPSSFVLLGTGLLGMAGVMRRRLA